MSPLNKYYFLLLTRNHSKASKTIISLPNAAGNIEEFEVYEASNFEPALQAQFPEIRAFSGKGITDKYATLKLSISPQGYKQWFSEQKKKMNLLSLIPRSYCLCSVQISQREREIAMDSVLQKIQKWLTGLNAEVAA